MARSRQNACPVYPIRIGDTTLEDLGEAREYFAGLIWHHVDSAKPVDATGAPVTLVREAIRLTKESIKERIDAGT